jgi:Transcriptional regulators
MSTRPTTIKDVASALGISASTVSRALSGHAGISTRTTEQVRLKAEEMGYVLNLAARQMRHRQSSLVGLVVPDIRNDFYSTAASVLAESCRSACFQMVLVNTEDNPEIEADQVQALIEARTAGIIICPTAQPHARTCSLLRSVPTVLFLRNYPGISREIVAMDDAEGLRATARHLLELGHSRVAYVGPRKDLDVGDARLRGYLEAHAEAGVVPDMSLVVLAHPSRVFGRNAMAQVLAHHDRPTALIIGSSELTVGGLETITEAGLRIPEDISLVVFGDPAWASLLTPPLTTVRLPAEAMARRAVKKIFHLISDSEQDQDAEPLLPRVIVRASTARRAF